MQLKNITQKHVSYLRKEQRKRNQLTLSFFMDSGEYVIEITSSRPEVFERKGVVKTCSKFTGEHLR